MPGLAEKLEQELALIVPNSIHTQVGGDLLHASTTMPFAVISVWF